MKQFCVPVDLIVNAENEADAENVAADAASVIGNVGLRKDVRGVYAAEVNLQLAPIVELEEMDGE